MLRFIVRLLPGILLLAAAVYLAVSSSDDASILHYAAAIAVAIPPALQVRTTFADKFGIPSSRKTLLDAALRTAIITAFRSEKALTPEQLTQTGFHVWLVPKWRRVVPYQLRRKVAGVFSDEFKDDHLSRFKLKRAAVWRLEPPEPADVPIRRGRGIIGDCLRLNKHDKINAINWERSDRAKLLAVMDREAWHAEAFEVNRGLKFEHAQKLSAAYGQAAAMVLRNEEKEPVGVVTLDLPHGVSVSVEDETGDDVLRHLTALRDQIETIPHL